MSTPKQSIYREYCAMENLGGKIQFLICSWHIFAILKIPLD
jgi:hypothetical protein